MPLVIPDHIERIKDPDKRQRERTKFIWEWVLDHQKCTRYELGQRLGFKHIGSIYIVMKYRTIPLPTATKIHKLCGARNCPMEVLVPERMGVG